MTDSAQLRVGDQTVELPVVIGSEGERAIDITKLRSETGYVTYDNGYANTGAVRSAITFIDGEKGILRYRGYPIEELAEKSDFLEVAYLLIYGELPNLEQYTYFTESVRRHTMLHEDFKAFFGALPKDAHPMAACSAAVGALSTFYPDSLDPNDPRHVEISVHRLLAKLPTIASYAYKHSFGQPSLYPRNELNYVANFMYMMFANPCEEYEVDEVIRKALHELFILHADHEQNASTSTVRLAGSSGANPFACIAAGIACLWGPAHGGANEAALNMLREIGTVDRIPEYIARAKNKDDPFRLMGFGHRVYKNYDPRATVMQKTAKDVLEKLGVDDPIFDVAKELEQIALNDPYFIEKKLYPNVDFYSGVILSAIGFPTEMFTVLFALARTVGWVAQWNEMISDPAQKIGRPRQLYTGPTQRDYVPVDKR